MTILVTHRRHTFSWWPVCLTIAACLMAIAVFMVTQSVQHHEKRVQDLNNRILAEQQSKRILEAEWAYLTRPQRIEELMALKSGTHEADVGATPANLDQKEAAQEIKPVTQTALQPVSQTVSEPVRTDIEQPQKNLPVASAKPKKAPTPPKTAKAPEITKTEKAAKPATKTVAASDKDIVWPIRQRSKQAPKVAQNTITHNASLQKPSQPRTHGGIARPILE